MNIWKVEESQNWSERRVRIQLQQSTFEQLECQDMHLAEIIEIQIKVRTWHKSRRFKTRKNGIDTARIKIRRKEAVVEGRVASKLYPHGPVWYPGYLPLWLQLSSQFTLSSMSRHSLPRTSLKGPQESIAMFANLARWRLRVTDDGDGAVLRTLG